MTVIDEVSASVKITPDTTFGGFDAYQKLLAAGVDLVRDREGHPVEIPDPGCALVPGARDRRKQQDQSNGTAKHEVPFRRAALRFAEVACPPEVRADQRVDQQDGQPDKQKIRADPGIHERWARTTSARSPSPRPP